jgi:AcrR family transcriptional regulator
MEVVLQAAARVLSKESLAGFTTNRVAEVAGVSIGSLYQYFPNKSALVAALIAREQTALTHSIQATALSTASGSLPSALTALIDVGIEHQFGNPLYAASLDHEERRLPLRATLDASQAQMVQTIEALLRRHFSTATDKALRVAAQDCLVISKALIEAEAAGDATVRDALRRRVLCALLGYLHHTLEPL